MFSCGLAFVDNVAKMGTVKEKIRIKKDEGYKTGRIKSWNTGLSKETNEILKESSNISLL
jgi:hypothetical protein